MVHRRRSFGHRLLTLLVLAGVLTSLAPAFAALPARAQQCAGESEPNDTEAAATPVTDGFCITGSLPASDQDIWLWTVTASGAATRWNISVSGVPGTVTGLKFLPITSAPGTTPVAGNQLFELDTQPDQTAPSELSGLIFPAGRYLVGMARSGTADGGEPPDASYRFSIEPGDPMPEAGDREPNDQPDQASPVSGAFSISGDLQGSNDEFVWTVDDASAAKGWMLQATGPVGRDLSVELQKPDGGSMVTVRAGKTGRVVIPDIALATGDYRIRVGNATTEPNPYVLTASEQPRPANDLEPNDSAAAATTIDPAKPVVRGRLGREGDVDYYSFNVDATLGASLIDVRLIWRSDRNRQLCVYLGDGTSLQCKSGTRGVSLDSLLLHPGTYLFAVSGDASSTDQYLLRIDATSAPADSYEAEPNDSAPSANLFGAGSSFSGRFLGTDTDWFRLTVTGDPQLWQLDATGENIDRFGVATPDGTIQAEGEIASDRASARLTDLFLTPGEHWFRIGGTDGDYQITATSLGPPDPRGEREPNNSAAGSEPLAMGVERNGRLVQTVDTDYYRFSLSAVDHVIITVTPPMDGAIEATLDWSTTTITKIDSAAPGAPIVYDADLQPGDYVLQLSPITVSEGKYTVSIERADPFVLAADQEPNDSFNLARPLPASFAVEGVAGGSVYSDYDWYLLPVLDRLSGVTVKTTGAISVQISDGVNDLPVTANGDGSFSARVPAGSQYAVQVSGTGPYTLGVTFADGPSPAPARQLPISMTFTAPVDQIAAYWPIGQQIATELDLANTGLGAQTLTLDAIASDPAWSVAIGQPKVQLAIGQRLSIPVTVTAQADRYSDVPVRITIRATSDSGAFKTAFVEITPGPDAPPVAPTQVWPVPVALLGGLDVASLALGAAPAGTVDQALEAQLHDGLTPTGAGFVRSSVTFPVEFTVDLAGDTPAPIAGFTLDPRGGLGWVSDQIRDFEFQLSTDGATFQTVYQGRVSPYPGEQYFVLPAPIEATYARLRILSTWWTSSPGGIALGEWKVIATPRFSPSADPQDIAAVPAGGHVVVMNPQPLDLTSFYKMLSPELDRQTQNVKEGERIQWIVGFQADRAARITGMRWTEPEGSVPESRLKRVKVELSETSPLGPWTSAGTWNLTLRDDGTVAPFNFDAPVWARFIRFTSDAASAEGSRELPAQLQIFEAPAGDGYLSMLGLWDGDNPDGPYEITHPVAVVAPEPDPDNDAPAGATELDLGQAFTNQVQIGKDVDWYRVTVPADQNTLVFTITGDPIADARVTVQDAQGGEVPVEFGSSDGATATFTAIVKPGASYLVRVEQPPHSIVFAFDTSTSLANYEPQIHRSMRAFAASVTPGQEFVNIIPFDEQPLLDPWSDQPYEIQSSLNSYRDLSLSSSAETAILDSANLLESRDGARSIVLITDADTSSFDKAAEMWAKLAKTRSRIYAVHIGAGADPRLEQHFMQDWAISSGGHYQYSLTQGDMDRAFDRAAVQLRRPVAYTISVAATTSDAVASPTPQPTATPAPTPSPEATPSPAPTATPTREPQPSPAATTVKNGKVEIVAGHSAGGKAPVVAATGAIEIILDTSGSMLQELEAGRSRADVARAVLTDLVQNTLPEGVPVTLRTFGDTPDSCDTTLQVPLGPLDREAMTAAIAAIPVINLVRTPIGAALEQVANDLKGVEGPKVVVLVTDGEETCGGDPAAAIQSLVDQGIDVRVNIVGFALDDAELKRTFRRWARIGNGNYFDATNSEELNAAVASAAAAPFTIYDATGKEVASGTVGGRAISLPAGAYTVVVFTDPVWSTGFRIEAGETATIEVTPDDS